VRFALREARTHSVLLKDGAALSRKEEKAM